MKVENIKVKLASALLVASSFLFTGAALAQTTAPAAVAANTDADTGSLQEVTVSASAITISGYDQPTPVQSLGIEQLQSAAKVDLTDALRGLPAFAGSSSPQNTKNSDSISTGVAALDLVDLRSLGINRTLVLIDGQRVVYGSLYGGVDTSNIPTALVKRVDVVTGGASAIWGSDAVAGVVNYVLNHNFNGVEVNVQDGNDWQHDHATYRADITAGTSFADGRGHIEGAASYLKVPDARFTYQIEGDAPMARLVENPSCQGVTASGGTLNKYGFYCPSGQPWFVPATHVGLSKATPGGLVDGCLNSGGVAISPCPLTNTYFVGANATPTYFNQGNVTQSYNNGGTRNDLPNYFPIQGAPQENTTAFAFGSFKLTDHVEVTAQLNWGYNSFYQDSYFAIQNGSALIQSGNPYIPAATQAQMTALGVQTLQIGTINSNPLTGPVERLTDLVGTVGATALFESRRLTRGVLGLDGDFGDNWSWNAYYERSETRQFETGINNQYVPARTNALNAVRVGSLNSTFSPTLYTNPLNIPVGTITCASNLLAVGAAGRTTNCAPLDIFGTGPGIASQAAIDYIQGVSHSGGNSNYTDLDEQVAAANIQGKLPFGLPAGPVAMAAGLVYRKEYGEKVNCGDPCNLVQFPLGNFASFDDGYNIKEGSVEFNAPILKDTFVKDLSIDAAYRGIEYSTSGYVSTYKLGVLSQITDEVRFRASYSRDIRAGNLSELFGHPATDGTSVIDPRTGINVQDYAIHQGNPTVLPETAETRTFGFVLTPVQGLFTSIDWYYIRIKEAINDGLSGTAIVNGCIAGNAAYCQSIYYGTFPSSGGCSGPSVNSCPVAQWPTLFGVVSAAVNSDSESTSGVDFVADYRMPFMEGGLDISANANYSFFLNYTTLGVTCDPLNGLSGNQGTYAGCNVAGNPKLKASLAVTYAQGPWTGTVQTRVIGKAHLVSNWESGVQVPNNDIPAYYYFDLRSAYNFADGAIQVYGALDNIFDRKVPITPDSPYTGATLGDPSLRDDIYDGYGRVWRLGIRMKF